MINEGAKILNEGITARSLDIDMALIHGFGYPAWRGGPMFEADEIGTAQILEDVRSVSRSAGPGWEPASLLIEMDTRGFRFGDWRRGTNEGA